MKHVEVVLKTGKTISVMHDEVDGLKKAGLLKTGKAKEKEEKEKAKTKEEKGAGVITKANFKK